MGMLDSRAMADDEIRPEQDREHESFMVRLLRKPLVVALAILAFIATAFQVAGVNSMLVASIILAAGVWIFVTAEVWCSKWIRKSGPYIGSIVLSVSGFSGTLAVGLAMVIAELRAKPGTPVLVVFSV